jgi:hypothetical protein
MLMFYTIWILCYSDAKDIALKSLNGGIIMRKTVLMVCMLLLLPGLSHAAGYVIGTYGFGGKMDGSSWGVELGGVFLSDLHPNGDALSAGIGFSVGNTDDNPPSASVPPTGVSPDQIKKYNDGNEYEGYVNFGAELMPSLFGSIGIGYSTQKVLSIGQSGGAYYETRDETEKYVTGMIGLRYVIEGFSMGIGFHTRRGVMLNLGVAF